MAGHPHISVSEAVETRGSVRAFLDRLVPRDMVEDIVRQAARAPSGGNLQSWVARIVDGEEIAALKRLMRRAVLEMPEGEPGAPEFYPHAMKPAYLARRHRNAEILYGALGISRDDTMARKAWTDQNFQFFGAPTGVMLFMERQSTPYQWIDMGIYLQTVLLLLREAGFDSCPQADWALYERTVKQALAAPPDLTLVCGISIGHADPEHPENFVRTERDDPLTSYSIR